MPALPGREPVRSLLWGHEAGPERRRVIQAILFDVVGTLLRVRGSVRQIYADVGSTLGLAVAPPVAEFRFRAAFRAQESLDAARGWQTDAEREANRWRAILQTVFHDQSQAADPFPVLWEHFSQPASWECFPDVSATLAELAGQGLRQALGSNFDSRLHTVLDGFPELAGLRPRFIRAEVGWSKPAPEFYARVVADLGLPPEAILVVGDDERNDVAAARAAGLRALLLDRRGGNARNDDSLMSLAQLGAWLRREQGAG